MGDKSTFQELRDAAARWKRKADEVRGQAEEIAGEVISTVGVAGGCAAAGFLDELKGADIGNGIRQHKVGSIPTSLGAGVLLEGAAAFGLFGKYSRIGYAVGQGGVGAYANTMGRLAGANMREKSASRSSETTDTVSAPVAKTGTDG